MHDGRIVSDRPLTDRLDAVEVLASMPAPEEEPEEADQEEQGG